MTYKIQADINIVLGQYYPRREAIGSSCSRPYGESAIALAKAWMRAGKPERAAPLIDTELSKGWDTAEAYWILGEVHRKLGNQQRADQAKANALRRNSQSEKMYALAP